MNFIISFEEDKAKSQLKGMTDIKRRIEYYLTEKYDYKNLGQAKTDSHKGNEFLSTNIELDMLTPHELRELGALQTESEYNEYMNQYAEAYAQKFIDLSFGEWDLGSFVISMSKEEASNFKTEEELSEFLLLAHNETMKAISNCAKIEDVNFRHLGVVHLKETNPHVHSNLSSKTFDGHKVDFYRGDSECGLIKLLNDVKFDLEARYPHILLQMEHEKREKELKVKLEGQVLKGEGDDAEFIEAFKILEAQYTDDNYYHADFKKDFAAAGFKVKFQKINSPNHKKSKELLVSYKDGEFKSLATLDFKYKRLIEKYNELEHASNVTHTDVSKIILEASRFINSSSLNLEDLNKELKEKFNVVLGPKDIERHQKTGEYLYNKWSIHILDVGLKFSPEKYGIKTKQIPVNLEMVKRVQQQIIELQNESLQGLKMRGYEKNNRYDPRKFYRLQGETLEEWKERQAQENMKSVLATLEKQGSDLFGINHRKQMSVLSPNELLVYRGGERAAVQMYISLGFKSIEFTGQSNAQIQAKMYVEAALHGLKVKNYTPDDETRAIAQKGLDSTYNQIIGKNIALIDLKIERMKADLAEGKPVKNPVINLQSNKKFEIEVDVRPKLYGYIYGVYSGLKPSVFADMQQALNDTPKDVLKSVVDHFQLSETLTDDNLATILKSCHIELDEEKAPVYKLPQAYNPEAKKPEPSQQAPGAEEAKPAKPTEPTPVQPKPQPEQEPKPVVTYPTGTNPTQQNGTQTQAQQAQEDKQKQEQERDKALGREALKKLKEKL